MDPAHAIHQKKNEIGVFDGKGSLAENHVIHFLIADDDSSCVDENIVFPSPFHHRIMPVTREAVHIRSSPDLFVQQHGKERGFTRAGSSDESYLKHESAL